MLTDPEEAADFVQKTGVDALAIAIGTSHGATSLPVRPQGTCCRLSKLKPFTRAFQTHTWYAWLVERAAGVAQSHKRIRW